MATVEKPRILIVDDTEVNLILLETLLRKEQAEIFKARNGELALSHTSEREFALILLDVSLPGMNGFEIAEHLRKSELNSQTPIIFISAILYDKQSISRGYQSGAVDYLTKPFQNEILLSKVRIFLKIYQQNKELQQKSSDLNESLTNYRRAEETLRMKYQLERMVSLASARFSGNFEATSSIEFMLMDIARLCSAVSAFFVGFNDDIEPVRIVENSESVSQFPFPEKELLNQLQKKFSINSDGCSLMISSEGMNGPWRRPDPISVNLKRVTIAIPVNIDDKPGACIMLNNCSGLGDWGKEEICSLGVFGTITGNAMERAATRKALEQSESNYRSYIENAPEGILVTNERGEIMEVNPGALNIFDQNRELLMNQCINHIFRAENLAGKFSDFAGLTAGDKAMAEFFLVSGKSSKIIRAISSRLPDGRFLVFCNDITAAREMEKHLIHTERMVGIGEMATGIAHEINQPLNTISFGIDNLMLALQSDKADPEYINEKARKLFDGIHRMRTIIDHVRTFSRSNDDYIHTAFSVNESITNALSLVNEQFKNHGLQINTQLADNELVQVQGNTYKIEQVVLNLLSNARDATDEKKLSNPENFVPTISIRSFLDDETVCIVVEDNGPGILSENLGHITTPFFTTKQPGKGTGLGLAISYGIVKEHEGRLNFGNRFEGGASVEVCLPALKKKHEKASKIQKV